MNYMHAVMASLSPRASRKSRILPLALGILSILALFLMPVHADTFTVLHDFAGALDDGAAPNGSLTLDGSTLYGMTRFGGDFDSGTVFKINTDGAGYAMLHEFAGGVVDGSYPRGGLTLNGSTIYGMTAEGSGSDSGILFKTNTDGTGYTLLREFAGGAYDGALPNGNLALDGSALYGMTATGGDSNYGTVFKVNLDGTGFSLLHEFAGGVVDGYQPRGNLTLDGSTLYGMTRNGGDNDRGTVFKMNADGTGYALLHEFNSPAGANPHGSLTLSGTTLYGMTRYGGGSGYGTVFKINAEGTGFTLLHEFADGPDDGRDPHGNLIMIGSTLYGMTARGGDGGYGTVFRMNADGTDFTLLHEFDLAQGASPFGSLTRYGTTLYGMAGWGGAYENGIIFSLALDPETIPEPVSLLFYGTGLAGVVAFGAWQRGAMRKGDGKP